MYTNKHLALAMITSRSFYDWSINHLAVIEGIFD